MDPITLHRLHFAFTATFHYLFPQLTMGLALLIVILKTLALRTGNEQYNLSARFWARIFAVTFAMGVVTGIPLEFQFGTNWSRFSRSGGGVIGQSLAMEGVFSFFLESSFLGLLLFGEKRLGPKAHWFAAFCVFLGAWLSGFFIIVTNAWMQHPVGYTQLPNGDFAMNDLAAVLLNPWALWQYLHNMTGSVITASFAMASTGAFYLLNRNHEEQASIFVRLGVSVGLLASIFAAFPTGDAQGKNVARYQPATLAAMEGLFETKQGAPMAVMGQPDPEKLRLDNPIEIPKALSFITYMRWNAEVKGLSEYDRSEWPDNMPLLFYSFHIMIGLGTIFIGAMFLCALALWRGVLFHTKPLLWLLMLLFPFPFIANTAGWMTAELGRQPWLIYKLMPTAKGGSPLVSSGNVLFTLIGFMGIYLLLGMLYLFLVYREIEHGPVAKEGH